MHRPVGALADSRLTPAWALAPLPRHPWVGCGSTGAAGRTVDVIRDGVRPTGSGIADAN